MTPLSRALRRTLWFVALINLVVGVLFLLDPELGTAPWPTPIAPVLVRFVGAIVLGNAAGAAVVAKQATWEGARALFAVALAYGVVALAFVTYQLASSGGPSSLWVYVVVDAVFIVPIAGLAWSYERRSAKLRN